MLEELKQNWQRFKAGLPGRRFQQQFRYRQQLRSGPVRRALFIVGGILVAAAGVFFLFAPGPGIVIFLVGAVVIARQSFFAARAFDRVEMQLRRFVKQRFGVRRRPHHR
jgi:Flp pilus assembly protein TadB